MTDTIAYTYETLRAELKVAKARKIVTRYGHGFKFDLLLRHIVDTADDLEVQCEAYVWQSEGKTTTLPLAEVSYERPVSLWHECKARLPWLARAFGPAKTAKVVLREAQTVNLRPFVQFPKLPDMYRDERRLEWVVYDQAKR